MTEKNSSQQNGQRIYQSTSDEEKARYAQIRERIQSELPQIKERGREKLAEAILHGVEIQHITSLLKAERLKQGLSLSDLNKRTQIDRATLSKLENNKDTNPTISTIVRYAEAVGKKVVVTLASTTS